MRLKFCIFNWAVNFNLGLLFSIVLFLHFFVGFYKCLYWIHFARFPYRTANIEAVILAAITRLFLLYIARIWHAIRHNTISVIELSSTFLSQSCISTIHLAIQSHVLILVHSTNVASATEWHLLVIFLLWMVLHLGWVRLWLKLMWWLCWVPPITSWRLLSVHLDFLP